MVPDKIQASRWDGMFTPPSLQGTIVFPGNVGGVNWGSAAYDPVHHTMVANTNRLIAWIKLIPRDSYQGEQHKQQDNRIYGEFGKQEGAPYGLYRTFLFLPADRLATHRRGGTTEAVDLFTGKKVWDVPLGTLVPGMQTGSINLGGPMITAGGLVFASAGMDLNLHAFESKPAKSFGSICFPPGARLLP